MYLLDPQTNRRYYRTNLQGPIGHLTLHDTNQEYRTNDWDLDLTIDHSHNHRATGTIHIPRPLARHLQQTIGTIGPGTPCYATLLTHTNDIIHGYAQLHLTTPNTANITIHDNWHIHPATTLDTLTCNSTTTKPNNQPTTNT